MDHHGGPTDPGPEPEPHGPELDPELDPESDPLEPEREPRAPARHPFISPTALARAFQALASASRDDPVLGGERPAATSLWRNRRAAGLNRTQRLRLQV